jgi:hypothetical protein
MQSGERRGLLISKGWIQAVVIVFLFGFSCELCQQGWQELSRIPATYKRGQGTCLNSRAAFSGVSKL